MVRRVSPSWVEHRKECPFCSGTDMARGRPYNLDDNTIAQDFECDNCGGSWSRVFTYDHDAEVDNGRW